MAGPGLFLDFGRRIRSRLRCQTRGIIKRVVEVNLIGRQGLSNPRAACYPQNIRLLAGQLALGLDIYRAYPERIYEVS